VLLTSFALWSLTSALTPTEADAVPAMVAARFLVGVAQGFIFPSIHTVLAQWVPPHERSRSVSLTTSGMYFGAAAGMLLLPGLVAIQGPKAVFRAEALMGVSWALLWAKYSRDPPLSELPKASAAGFGAEDQKKSKSVSIPWRRILCSMAVWAIVVNNFTFHYALYVLMNWLPTYFEKGLDVSLHAMGVSKMVPYLVMFLFSNVGGVVADHVITRRMCSVTNTRKVLNSVGCGVAGVALMVMPGLRSPGSAVVCASVALGACALSRAGFAVNHLDIAPKYAGVVMGVSNTAGTVAGIVGVTVTGRILEGSALGASDPSSWYMVFATPALLSVVSALFFVVFATGERIFD
jgi:ACS family sodium-dependent inorganic phosphate cotransporter